MRECRVLGAGISGLTTALVLAEAGWRPRVLAREPWQRTVSAVAGGLCLPILAAPFERVVAWNLRSLERFYALAERGDTGVLIRECWDLSRHPPTPPWWTSAVRRFRPLAESEVPAGFVAGFSFETAMICVPEYMGWLEQQLAARGVAIAYDPAGVRALSDLHDEVIVNCTGLGARELVPDPSLLPVRGQIVRVRSHGQQRCFLDEADVSKLAYVMARRDDLILGGSADPGQEDTREDPALTRRILDRVAALDPSLGEPEILDVRVGLRPARPTVRVERDPDFKGILVHNYGHGGSGYALSWGCAHEVAGLLAPGA